MTHTKSCPTWRKCLCQFPSEAEDYHYYDCCGWYCPCGGHVDSPERGEQEKAKRKIDNRRST